MNILVIDAHGGGVGKALVAEIKKALPSITVTAVGTNSAATTAMKKAGADFAATGENSVVVCARNSDVIVGPIGIVIADSLLGEITPKMAEAVGQARAKRILIPMKNCGNIVVGTYDMNMSALISAAVEEIKNLL
ncbi:MAG: DUF3842 family protein [Oscillospiraceae bacterium]|nr:DUF3842 family protein [Oscillospiraceae bacterium]MBQ6846436.1 DUF3842 family protein [Oscillospiraceae bacterium]